MIVNGMEKKKREKWWSRNTISSATRISAESHSSGVENSRHGFLLHPVVRLAHYYNSKIGATIIIVRAPHYCGIFVPPCVTTYSSSVRTTDVPATAQRQVQYVRPQLVVAATHEQYYCTSTHRAMYRGGTVLGSRVNATYL